MKLELSICVPTFGRAAVLEEFLNTLARELKGLNDQVEICISDNASPDKTEDIVKKFAKSNSDVLLKYNKNLTNLGFDKNCQLALSMAKGKYRWLFSDDDCLEDGAIGKVLLKLRQDQPDIAFINYKIKVGEKDLPSSAIHTSIKSYKITECIEKISLANTMVSSNIYSAKALETVDLEEPNGKYWYHLFLFYAIVQANPGAKILYYGYPLIVQRGLTIEETRLERALEYNGQIEFYMDAYFSLLRAITQEETFRKFGLHTQIEKALTRQVLYYRLGNTNQSAIVKWKILSLLCNYPFKKVDKVAAAIILISPRKLMVMASKLRKYFHD